MGTSSDLGQPFRPRQKSWVWVGGRIGYLVPAQYNTDKTRTSFCTLSFSVNHLIFVIEGNPAR